MRRLFFVAASLLFLFAALLPTQSSFVSSAVSDGERLAMFSKPSVVRVIDGVAGTFNFTPPKRKPKNYTVSYIGLGSGFFINAAGYIVTNAHVVNTSHDIKQKGDEAGRKLLFQKLMQAVARDYKVQPDALTDEKEAFIRRHSKLKEMKHYHHVIIADGSVYEFEEKQFGTPVVGQGKDVAVIKIEVKNAPVLVLGNSDAIKLQDHVTVLGYPGAADTFNSGKLGSKSSLEASITDGKISAIKGIASGAPVLQVSAPATHGNSGGPVMTDKIEVGGLLTFGGDMSAFAFVIPSNAVLEFVKAEGISNELGLTDNAYHSGLELYWNQRYSEAIPKFEEVRRLFPQHSEVQHLIQTSQTSISEGKEKPIAEGKEEAPSVSSKGLISGAVLVFLVAVVIVATVITFFIFRKRRHATEPAAAFESAPVELREGAKLPPPPQQHRNGSPWTQPTPPVDSPKKLETPSPSGLVFVCYAREDQTFTLDLASALRDRGVNIWVDQWNIAGSADWDRSIDQALYGCTELLIVLSPAAVDSKEVRAELRTALEEDKLVVPVLYRECEIPRRLRLIQYFDFTSAGPADEIMLRKLASAFRQQQV